MGNKSFFTFLKEQLSAVPPVESANLKDKVILVIGANTGIGYETAKHFALMSAKRVILTCRSRARGDEALQKLRASTGYERAEMWHVDLASFASVRAFADKVDKEVERIDVLVANAGVITTQYEETGDGWESSLQINHIAPAFLILLLLPKVFAAAENSLSSGSPPRIVIVGSEAHQNAVISGGFWNVSSPLEAINEASLPYSFLHRYRLTKLLNIFFTQSLATHLSNANCIETPIVNCVNPGFCYSELRRSSGTYFTRSLELLLARTAEEGARQVIYASVAFPTIEDGIKPGADTMRGKYINFRKIEEPGDFVVSEKGKEFEKILWADTLRVLSSLDERIPLIIAKYLQN